MSKTQVYNYLKIAAIAMIALMALLFNQDNKVNLQTAIVFELIILAVTGIWRIAFHDEIVHGD